VCYKSSDKTRPSEVVHPVTEELLRGVLENESRQQGIGELREFSTPFNTQGNTPIDTSIL